MKRSVELLGGGVLGLVLGTALLASPIAAAMATYARASWSLSGCPVGNYTLTATAQLSSGGPEYKATTFVRVPLSEAVQVFNNVPSGLYTVRAVLRRSDGAVMGSGFQMVATEDGVAPAATVFRSRTPSQPINGTAGPRTPPPPPSTPTLTAPPPAVITPASNPPSRSAVPRPVSGTAAPREWLLAELIRLSDPDGAGAGWHQVQLVDLDGDGLVDEIKIEPPTGDTVVWRLVPERLPVR